MLPRASGPSGASGGQCDRAELGMASAGSTSNADSFQITALVDIEGRRGEHPDADDVDCRDLGRGLGLWHRRPWSPNPRKSTCKPRREWRPSRDEWKYHDVKIVEVDGKGPDGKPNKTYNIEPRADGADFDDSKWEVIAPETLKDRAFDRTGLLLLVSDQDHDPARSRRQGGLLPDDRRRLRRDLGRRQTAPNAGQRRRGRSSPDSTLPTGSSSRTPSRARSIRSRSSRINGPISAAPSNWLFLKNTALDIEDKHPK